jgi:hypothetical protein
LLPQAGGLSFTQGQLLPQAGGLSFSALAEAAKKEIARVITAKSFFMVVVPFRFI